MQQIESFISKSRIVNIMQQANSPITLLSDLGAIVSSHVFHTSASNRWPIPPAKTMQNISRSNKFGKLLNVLNIIEKSLELATFYSQCTSIPPASTPKYRKFFKCISRLCWLLPVYLPITAVNNIIIAHNQHPSLVMTQDLIQTSSIKQKIMLCPTLKLSNVY